MIKQTNDVIPGRHYSYGENVRLVLEISSHHLGTVVYWRKRLKNGSYGTKQFTLIENFRKKAVLIVEEVNPQ